MSKTPLVVENMVCNTITLRSFSMVVGEILKNDASLDCTPGGCLDGAIRARARTDGLFPRPKEGIGHDK
jgi:hypothetical protein